MTGDDQKTSSEVSFMELMKQPEPGIDLGLAALLIAADDYPELDPGQYISRLDEWGAEARDRISRSRSLAESVQIVSQFLFEGLGFEGNRDNYYDPRNSFLNDVMDRRLGIPISLSVVYMEVARRAGLDVVGLNFPGRFMVKVVHPAGFEIVVDAYEHGQVMEAEDCQRVLDELSNNTMAFHPMLLRAATTKQILVRMLNNLKLIYVQSNYYRKAIRTIDLVLAAVPNSPPELRERGLLRAEVADFQLAKEDLTAYLDRMPSAEGSAQVRQTLGRVEGILKSMD